MAYAERFKTKVETLDDLKGLNCKLIEEVMNVAIIGSDGYLGSYLSYALAPLYSIQKFDFNDRFSVFSQKFDTIVNCAIDRSDYGDTLKFVRQLIRKNEHIIQFSSHLRFPYNTTNYSRYLTALETMITNQGNSNSCTIVRLVRPIGLPRNGNENLANAFLRVLMFGSSLHLRNSDPFMVSNVFSLPDVIRDIADQRNTFRGKIVSVLGSNITKTVLEAWGVRVEFDSRLSEIPKSYDAWFHDADFVMHAPVSPELIKSSYGRIESNRRTHF